MPTLHRVGKEQVVNHHHEVPYKVLDKQYDFGDDDSGNMIIHGDNLEGLKSLLPQYESQIKCIYIDPPYNTGKEGWKYNDKMSHPKIEKRLGQIVGKEGEDFSRHDKWLCMMYPRLKLLHKLLAEDGVIFISIDDNEFQSLRFILNEIFGKDNFIVNFSWKSDGNFDNQAKVKVCHEYIITYAKNISKIDHPNIVDANISESSKLHKSEIINTVVKNGIKNPVSSILLKKGFPTDFEFGKISSRINSRPHIEEDIIVENFKTINDVMISSGWSAKKLLEKYIETGFKSISDTKGQQTDFILRKNGTIENIKKREKASHVISFLQNLGSTQSMSLELLKMDINFDYPKPNQLIEYFIQMFHGKDAIILDSFAGSGSTAHAVLNLNKADGGNRKFILLELMDYADTITAERVRRVISGYGEGKTAVEGTGGGFSYYTLGETLFDHEGNLNANIGVDTIREYIWYTETKQPYHPNTERDYHLGTYHKNEYYFYYEADRATVLDLERLGSLGPCEGSRIIYADICLVSKEILTKHNIIFKKIPRDITKF